MMNDAKDKPIDLEPTADDIVWVEEFLDGLAPEVVEAIRTPTARGEARRGAASEVSAEDTAWAKSKRENVPAEWQGAFARARGRRDGNS
jgi:hypothetical protein